MNPTLRSAGLTGLKCLNEAGYEAWWVGGCVRDEMCIRDSRPSSWLLIYLYHRKENGAGKEFPIEKVNFI